jgi:hypothetical protein
MPKDPLLPGVSAEVPPPVIIFESHPVIRRARRRALARDVFDLLLLVAVDVLFIRWPQAQIPLLNRFQSLQLLVAVNVLLLGYLWVSRVFPRWRARRVSATWDTTERERLTASLRSRASR